MRNACVIGWPIGHSRSPLIHNYWLRQHGIAGEYRAEAVPPDAFPEFLKSLTHRHYVGANVTLPHKEAALRLSLPDDRAEAVGAANTLWFEGGALRSTNTDVEGFLANLDAAAVRLGPDVRRSGSRSRRVGARRCVWTARARDRAHSRGQSDR